VDKQLDPDNVLEDAEKWKEEQESLSERALYERLKKKFEG
jgi:hypothetical protein